MASSKFMLMEETAIPKWKIALAVGGAVALSAGIYYKFYYNPSPLGTHSISEKKASKNRRSNDTKSSNGTSVTEKDDVSILLNI